MRVFLCFLLFIAYSTLNAQEVMLYKRITSSYDDHALNFQFGTNNSGMIRLFGYRNDVLFYEQSSIGYVNDPFDKPGSAFGKMLLVDSTLKIQNSHLFLERIDVDPISTGEDRFTLSGRFFHPLEPIRVGGRELFIDSLIKATALGGSNQHYITRFNSNFEIQNILSLDAQSTSDLELTYRDGEYVFALSASNLAKIEDSYYIASELDPLAESFTIFGKLDSSLRVMWTDTLFDCGFDNRLNQPIKYAQAPEVLLILNNGDILMLIYNGEGDIQYNEDTTLTSPDKSGLMAYLLLFDSNGTFKRSFAFENNPVIGDASIYSEEMLASNGETILHLEEYDESILHDGMSYQPGKYFVFLNDTLGVKSIINNSYASELCSASDGSFYWAGTMSRNQSYDFGDIHIDAHPTNRLIVGKISAEGEYLWVKTYNAQMHPYSITEQNKRLAVIGQLSSDFFDSNGDTLIKFAPSRHRTSGLLILEDQHVLGEEEVLNKEALLKVYPNPSNTSFTLEWVFEDEVELSVYDLSGRKVFSKASLNQADQLRLSPDNPGVYFIQISDAKQTLTRKIIKL